MAGSNGEGREMGEAAWQRYRDRVRSDSPVSRSIAQRQLTEDLLTRAAALDAHVTRVVRELDPGSFRAFLDVLTMLRASEFAAVSGDPQADMATWYAQMRADAAAGKADQARWAEVDRLASVLGLADKAVIARQLDPPCPPPAEQAPAGPDPEVLAAAQPLYARYSAQLPLVGYGTADESLDARLSALLADYRQLRGRQPDGSENWKFAQWWCAAATGSLARSAAIQRRAADAIREFGRAAAEWDGAGEPGKAADCLARAAEIALADGADVDEALDPLVRLAGPPAADAGADIPPTISRARLLARLAQLYLSAGDHFDAGIRAAECAEVLDRLGLADPARDGVAAAFAGWADADPGDDLDVLAANRAQALLSAAAEIWASVIAVRSALGQGQPATTAGADAPGAQATKLLSELAALTRRLGEEAHQVSTALGQEAVALGLPSADGAGGHDEIDAARARALDQHGRIQQQELELSELLDEFARCEDAGQLAGLLARTQVLAARILAECAPGIASAAATVSVLHADVLTQIGRLGEAAEVLTAARTRLGGEAGLAAAERRSLLVTVIGRAAMVAGYQGDFAGMSQLCGEGIADVERDRGLVNAPYLQDSYLRDRGRLYDWGTFAAHKTGDYDLMLARSELAKARGVLGWAVAGRGGPQASEADERAFQELTSALARPGGQAGGAQRAERRVLWERLMTARGRAGRGAAVPEFRLAAVQAALAANEAVICYYWLTRGTLLVITIDRAAVAAEKVNLTEAARDDLSRLVADLSGLREEVPWLDGDIPPCGRLLPREGRELLAGKDRLIISPHRLLHQLPFSALDYGGAPLAEQFAVRYVPNLTSLLLPARPARPPHVLALGVSAFTDPPLPPLPNAGLEAAAVARLYQQAGVPVTSLIDGQASRARLTGLREQGALAGFSTLHLVTHADDMPPDAPFDAALHLGAGTIDGPEISQWELGADLVVLSACYSGRRAVSGRRAAGQQAEPGADGLGEELFGDEVYGLQAAFFAAGARHVLGALWPAVDASARTCMQAFHQQLSAGQPADLALRQAMLGLRADGLPVYHWAPYKLVCLGGASRPGPRAGEEAQP
ncbi:MAG: CHAT domain-containing protein [Streptosporangiaceae bacterium]